MGAVALLLIVICFLGRSVMSQLEALATSLEGCKVALTAKLDKLNAELSATKTELATAVAAAGQAPTPEELTKLQAEVDALAALAV